MGLVKNSAQHLDVDIDGSEVPLVSRKTWRETWKMLFAVFYFFFSGQNVISSLCS